MENNFNEEIIPENNEIEIKNKRIGKLPCIWFLHSLQRISFVFGVICLAFILKNSVLFVDTESGGTLRYRFFNNLNVEVYEESQVFNQILNNKVSDIITLGAIQSQLETEGLFDRNKIVDVRAFNNRFAILPEEELPEQYLTAFYYLGDLISWSHEGFSYYRRLKTDQELIDFFVPQNILFDPKTNTFVEATPANDITVWTITEDITHAQLGDVQIEFILSASEDEKPIQRSTYYDFLHNNYQTIDGKNIEDYVGDLVSYNILCENIIRTANDLSFNLRQYERMKKSINNSNVYYLIRTTVNGEQVAHTNLILNNKFDDVEQIDAFFEQYGRYIKYTRRDPYNIEFDTNTDISADYIRQQLAQFSYAFPPQNTHVWIGVDTTYFVDDVFRQGYLGFQSFFPHYIYNLIFAVMSFIFFFVLLVILTNYTGRVLGEDGKYYTKLRNFDRIYTEIWLAAAGCAAILCLYVTAYNVNSVGSYSLARTNDTLILIVVGAFAYAGSLFFSLFYYSLVRRIKAKSLYQDSLLAIVVKYAKKLLKISVRLFVYSYNNSTLLIRYMTPVAGIVFYHIILLLFIANVRGSFAQIFFGMFILLADLIIGVLIFLSAKAREDIVAGINKISGGDIHHKVAEHHLYGDNLVLAKAVNSIGDSISCAVDISLRDERMKADLITNVSHDIKTPLTSIINYIDLIKREDITNETVKNYVAILDTKSQRLKQLTDDLVEASKISSGNIEFKIEKINLTELVNQTIGEFEDRFKERTLQINFKTSQDNLMIEADSRRIWRVVENLFNNIYKYAMPNTRVYIELNPNTAGQVELSIKNISEQPLNFNADELTERFIRGDVSRSTEGSGLGLSIAKSLTEAQNGQFEIVMDGDLFKVMLTFPLLEKD